MKKFVGGTKITIDKTIKVIKFLNEHKGSFGEYYGFGCSKNNEYFLMQNGYKRVMAYTFVSEIATDETGKETESLNRRFLGYVDFDINKRTKNLHIEYIEVGKTYQDQGIGNELLAYVESYAKKQGCVSVTLDCLQTYTNGIESFPYRGDVADEILLDKLKESGKVVDKNLMFYMKNNYVEQKNRAPLYDFLIPMVKNKIKCRKPKIKNLASTLNFRLSPLAKGDMLKISKNCNENIGQLIKKHKYSSVFDTLKGKQI